MPAYLVDRVAYKLDGNFVRVEIVSGNDARMHAIPIAQFIHNYWLSGKVIAEFEAKCGTVVPFKKAKRGKH